MKYMFRLTSFAMLCLLIASCHSSNSKITSAPSVDSTAVVRGVIEKGKVTGANCYVSKASQPDTIFSTAIVQEGAYTATVPREPFIILCRVTSYVSDLGTDDSDTIPKAKTGQSIELETFGAVETAKEKTLNINVLTTLVTRQTNNLSSLKYASDVDNAKQTAIGILNQKYDITIGNIDELRLKDKGVLAKVSMAVQTKLKDDWYSFDSDDPVKLDKADIKAVTLANFNDAAIAESNDKLTPPQLETTHKPIPSLPVKPSPPGIQYDVESARIGGIKLNTGTVIHTDKPIPFSIGASTIILEDGKTAYLTSNKPSATLKLLVLDKANSVYKIDDVRDLLVPDTAFPTDLYICIMPTISPVPSDVSSYVDNCIHKLVSPNVHQFSVMSSSSPSKSSATIPTVH